MHRLNTYTLKGQPLTEVERQELDIGKKSLKVLSGFDRGAVEAQLGEFLKRIGREKGYTPCVAHDLLLTAEQQRYVAHPQGQTEFSKFDLEGRDSLTRWIAEKYAFFKK
jgi:hypothetical protein